MVENAMYKSIETGLNKAAIFIVIKNNGTLTNHLVTLNKSIISFFDNGFTQIPYGKNIENNTIEAYELRYNRVVNLDTTHVHEVYYYGLPVELAPPVFLNPAFKNIINDNMIVESQLSEFLIKVKKERDEGMYQEHPYVEADVDCLYRIKHFFAQEYDITSDNSDVLELFDKYEIFNIMSNTVAVKNILELEKKMFFLPAILECAGSAKDDLKNILSEIIDNSAFSKDKWIQILEAKRSSYILDYQKQLEDLKQKFVINSTTNIDISSAQAEYESLHNQFVQIIENLTQISFVDELSLYDDYRLYLRYWPSLFMDTVEFHNHIRPFTDLEHLVIKLFIRAGIEFDYDSIYRKDFDFYNSIITDLEIHTETWREYKLKHITEVAASRAEEIRTEMIPLCDALTPEERVEFDKAIAELTDIDAYIDTLKNLTRLTDVMSYWPVSLYPVPNDTLQL